MPRFLQLHRAIASDEYSGFVEVNSTR